jgi:hypothetical protein
LKPSWQLSLVKKPRWCDLGAYVPHTGYFSIIVSLDGFTHLNQLSPAITTGFCPTAETAGKTIMVVADQAYIRTTEAGEHKDSSALTTLFFHFTLLFSLSHQLINKANNFLSPIIY